MNHLDLKSLKTYNNTIVNGTVRTVVNNGVPFYARRHVKPIAQLRSLSVASHYVTFNNLHIKILPFMPKNNLYVPYFLF